MYPLAVTNDRSAIPVEAVIFENLDGIDHFYMPSTGDLYISNLMIPEEFVIPDNLPETVQQLFREMKTLEFADYENNHVWERLNAIIQNPAYVAESGFRASESGVQEGDFVYYGKTAYVVLQRIRNIDPEVPDEVEISLPIHSNPVRAGRAAWNAGTALVTGGGIVPTEYVRVPVNNIFEFEGVYYIRDLPFDGYNVGGWVGSTIATFTGMTFMFGGKAGLAALVYGGVASFPTLVTKVFDRSWVYGFQKINPWLTRRGADAIRIAGGLAGAPGAPAAVNLIPGLGGYKNYGYTIAQSAAVPAISTAIAFFYSTYWQQSQETNNYVETSLDSGGTKIVSVAKATLKGGGELAIGTARVIGGTIAGLTGTEGMGEKVSDAVASGTYTLMATVGVFLGIALYQKLH